MSQSQPRDGRKGPRAGNIVNSSKNARPPWAIGATGNTSPRSPSTAFKASVLHVSPGLPHAGPGGRRTRRGLRPHAPTPGVKLGHSYFEALDSLSSFLGLTWLHILAVTTFAR